MRQIFKGLVGALSAGGNLIGMVLIAIMVVHVTAEVVSRALFRAPIPGTIEIGTYYYMIAAAFVPLGYVQWRREHIEAEAIADILPHAWRKWAARIGMLFSIAITLLITYATVLAALRQTRVGAAVWTTVGEIPIWPSRWLLPIGFGAFALVMIYQLWTDVFGDDESADNAPSLEAQDERH